MTNENKPARRRFTFWDKMIATSFGFGYWPWGPGTMGAVFGLMVWCPVFYFCSYTTTIIATLALIAVFTAIGIPAASASESEWGEDPSRVVMDETVGMWISLLAVPAGGPWWNIAAAFVLFRLFDIFKPLGVRKMESLGGGLGIMADDILAGIYSAVVLFVANLFI